MKSKTLKAPGHLAEPTRAWWRSVMRDFVLEPHHVRLLTGAAEAWDRAQQARQLLDRDGLCIPGREGGLRAHPAAAIERDSRIAFARMLRELDLDTEPPANTRTAPAALRSNRRGS